MRAETITSIKREMQAEFERMQHELRRPDFPVLPPLPIGRYARADFDALEQRHLWPRTWLLAGHISELPEPGCYKRWDRGGFPVVLVHGKDRRIRAFFNVCQHRGGPLVTETFGRRTALACAYHSWTYGLDGQLNYVPDEFDFGMLDRDVRGLVELRCETWGGLIFVNQDANCVPLKEFLGPLEEATADLGFDESAVFAKLDYELNCNWKCIHDNFLESYHLTTVHPETVAKFITSVAARRIFPNGHGEVVLEKKLDTEYRIFDHVAVSDDPELELSRAAQRSYYVFPNLTIPTSLTQFPIVAAWPTGPESSHLEVYYLGTRGNHDPASEACTATVAAFDRVTQEDVAVLDPLGAAYRSGAIHSIPLCHNERLIYHFHETLDRTIGLDRVPADLAVPQILAGMATT